MRRTLTERSYMRPHQITDESLAPELESIAAAAADRLRVHADGSTHQTEQLRHRVAQAASAAIAAGLGLGAIANAERIGQDRARQELGTEVLRQVRRAARRKREAEQEYQQAVQRAARLGVAHRDIATEAQVAHGTVRAIIARTETPADNPAPPPPSATTNGERPEPPQPGGWPSTPGLRA